MWVKAGGVTVWAEQAGPASGEAAGDVLLLHGWGCQIGTMAALMKALAQTYRVTAIDFPGHGKTPEPPVPWSVTEYAKMTEEVIVALNLVPCHVVAHSFGGRVAILLGAEHAELLGRMLITGGAGLLPKKTPVRAAYNALLAAFHAAARALPFLNGLKERLAPRFASSDYNALGERMKKTFVRVIGQDLRPFLSAVTSPVLLVWGQNDRETPLWYGQTMEREMPAASLTVYRDAGHYAFLEQPERFTREALCFLKGETT